MRMEHTNPEQEAAAVSIYFVRKSSYYTCLVKGCGNPVDSILSCALHAYGQPGRGINSPCRILVCSGHYLGHIRGNKMMFSMTTSGCFESTNYNNMSVIERAKMTRTYVEDVEFGAHA